MRFSFEIGDNGKEYSILLKNLDLELINKITIEENLEEIVEIKYYKYSVYDKIEILGSKFMILKNTKKFIELLNLGNE